MMCATCGGLVLWRGWRMNNFTHTECQSCGAVNNQIIYEHGCEYDDETEDDEDEQR